MTNRETVSQAIHAIFGNLSDADIEIITEAGLEIGRANVHYGLNSQVAANELKASIVRDVLDRMQTGTVDHIAELIGRAYKHPMEVLEDIINVRVTVKPIEGAELHELDRDVAGSYCYEIDHAADDTAFDLGEAALDRFHNSVAIKVLDDFDIDTEIL